MPGGAFALVIRDEADSVLGYEPAPYVVDAASSATHVGRIISLAECLVQPAAGHAPGPATNFSSGARWQLARSVFPVSLIVVCRTA
jgi:hypothetical protein